MKSTVYNPTATHPSIHPSRPTSIPTTTLVFNTCPIRPPNSLSAHKKPHFPPPPHHPTFPTAGNTHISNQPANQQTNKQASKSSFRHRPTALPGQYLPTQSNPPPPGPGAIPSLPFHAPSTTPPYLHSSSHLYPTTNLSIRLSVSLCHPYTGIVVCLWRT